MDDTPTGNGKGDHPGRVWRACLECRRKKSKCDGKDRCTPCRTRNRECIYPESRDNASSSRQLAATLDARCQQMDSLCQRMDALIGKFNEIAESLGSIRRADMVSSVPVYIPNAVDACSEATQQQIDDFLLSDGLETSDDLGDQTMNVDKNIEEEETLGESSSGPGNKMQDHVMTTDSYGKLRYVGGTGTMVMIEALRSLSPGSPLVQSPIDSRSPEKVSVSRLELPFFVRGQTWPQLPFLPQADQLVRPPRYISDLLINLYFDQLHFTMPVIYKPHFMQRYSILLNRSSTSLDTAFLSVFFAVCACASGILPRDPGNSSMFTGLQYYESALLLHYASTGEGSIEQVQCLALLSMCTAGWNTLAQSWKFAGQAVRAAQDLGLHRSPARGAGEILKEELCRRIWWSVYGLDRLLSICLGRPMGVEDSDCDCEIPLDMDDSELETYCKAAPEYRPKRLGPSRLSGFISFSRLCHISGRIVRSTNPLKTHRIRRKADADEQLQIAESLGTELEEWLQTIPDSIKKSANSMDLDFGSPHLTMCVILYIVHAGCVINLHQPLIPNLEVGSNSVVENQSLLHCIHAARSCIRVGELIQERVPPSHLLAFCTHYLTLSGIFLIRSSNAANEDTSSDVENCLRSLTSLETVWTGARRSKLILQELLKHSDIPKNTDWGSNNFGPDELMEYMLRPESSDFTFGGLEPS